MQNEEDLFKFIQQEEENLQRCQYDFYEGPQEEYDQEACYDEQEHAQEDDLINSGEVLDEMDFQDADQIEQELDLQSQFPESQRHQFEDNNYLAPLQQNHLENENQVLKTQLELRNQQLLKTEEKLNKKRQFIKEMSSIQNEISQIKKKNPAELEEIATENRVLKSKIAEMESQINSMSTNINSHYDVRNSLVKEREIENLQEIKIMFDEKLSQMQKENQEKQKFFDELKQTQAQQEELIAIKDQIIHQLQYQLDQKNTESDYRNHTAYGSGQEDQDSRAHQSESQLMRQQQVADHKFVSLRNQNAGLQDYVEMPLRRQVISDAELLNFSDSNGAVEQDFAMEPNQDQFDETESEDCISRDQNHKAPFYLNESKINKQKQQVNRKSISTRNSHYSEHPPLAPISPKSHPVSILITSNESTQIKRLNERCEQLEFYCKDLIKTNKILDLENRLCISQILNLTNQSQGGSKQLDNLVGALHLLQSKGNQVYSTNRPKDIFKFK